MKPIDNRIHLLDDISQRKIKYSVQILSLNDVILELIKNALDAQAQHIKIVLNYTHGFCSVLDDGHGIPTREFEEHGGLGKPFHTSKSGRALTFYGRNGRYLAALAGLSLLSIASRTRGGHTDVLWLDDTGRLRCVREPSDTLEVKTGTRVKVYGLFSKLPVRSKALLDRFSSSAEVHNEFDTLKREVLGLLLAASIHFSVVIEHASPKLVYRHRWSTQQAVLPSHTPQKSISQVISAFRQAAVIEASQSHEWQEISVQSSDLEARGLIMKLPIASKSAQYISLNHLPLTKHAHPNLYLIVNGLFGQSTFGSSLTADATEPDQNQHGMRSQGLAKGVDRWPMFAIWIHTTSDCVQDLSHDAAMSLRAQTLSTRITNLVENMIEEFLLVQGFTKPRKHRSLRALKAANSSGDLQAVSTDKRAEQSKESFRHWSRIKSTRVSVLDNILTGLPFHQKTSPLIADALSRAENSSPSDEDSDATLTNNDTSASTKSAINGKEFNEFGHVLWTDPQTGRALRLDARTGMELPQGSAWSDGRHDGAVGNEVTVITGHEATDRRSSSLHRTHGDLSVGQVANNIQRYSTKHASRIEQPIRSISFSTQDGEDLEKCRTTHKDKVESFWVMDPGSNNRALAATPNISREPLRSAKVLRQVDRKFVLATMQSNVADDDSDREPHSQLVLIDQHAADERCKVEALVRSVHYDEGIVLSSPIIFEVSSKERNLLQSARSYFARWSILYEVSIEPLTRPDDNMLQQVKITSLPSAIAERCRLHPRLVIDILREGIWSDNKLTEDHNTLQLDDARPSLPTAPMPPRLLDMINSRACRSAIMFNDILTTQQCETLVRQLSDCTLPFQCAHGRPSMVVLANIDNLDSHRPLAPHARNTKSYFETRNGRGSTPSGLNTIENYKQSFGEAYHSWINSQTIDDQMS